MLWHNKICHLYLSKESHLDFSKNNWAGIFGNQIVVPIFLKENLACILLFRNSCKPTNLLKLCLKTKRDLKILLFSNILFNRVRNWLTQTYPDREICIGIVHHWTQVSKQPILFSIKKEAYNTECAKQLYS